MLGKRRAWEIVDVAGENDTPSRVFDFLMLGLILASTLGIVLESVPSIRTRFQAAFDVFELFSVSVFTAEYVVRTWACTADARFRGPVVGRLRHAVQPLVIVDLLAIAPFFLAAGGFDLRFVRLLRAFRVLRLAKLTRYSKALWLMGRVLRRSWDELAITLFVIAIMILLASIAMYSAEHEAQPEAFSDIPSTMWWAVTTLTTVGYGDLYPVTVGGKIIASLIALLGIGLLAMPTAILGSAFVEELKQKARKCPHCGGPLDRE